MEKTPYLERVARCADLMRAAGLDVLILTKPANMFYLVGDGRLCSYAMVARGGRLALGVPQTDLDDVKRLAVFDEIVCFEDEVGMIHSIAHFFKAFGVAEGTVGLEYTFLTQSMMSMMTHPHAKPAAVVPKDCTPVMTALRLVKSEAEIDAIREAAKAAEAGMTAAIGAIEAGVTESQVAGAAELAMRQAGAEGFWRTYVCSGPRTSIAHGLPSARRLGSGDLVMIDLHPIVGNYSADLCRMACVGEPTEEQRAAQALYVEAQQAAVALAKAGVRVGELEKAMRDPLERAGNAGHVFGPPLHGVGIEFEEAPLPAGHAFFHGEKAPPPLDAGVVVAVGNCGLYTGPWGIRVEDTVAIGRDGPLALTTYPRDLAVCD